MLVIDTMKWVHATGICRQWRSKKFDVFSLGVIIIKLMDGNNGSSRSCEMPPEQFVELVTNKWKERVMCQSAGYSLQEINILGVRTCVDIALRCVDANRNRRPYIIDIINELEELEAKVEKISLSSEHQSKNLNSLQRWSDSNALAVDPTSELRFPFEPRKDISCCLQLTNKMDGSIAFNIKTNQSKYYAEPNRGILPPCSKRYVLVTLRAQEEAPPNMQCHDMLHIQSVNVREDLTPDGITEDFFERGMVEKVVDVMTLPIVFVAKKRRREFF